MTTILQLVPIAGL